MVFSLLDLTVDKILASSNCKFAMSSLWHQEGLIPELIRQRSIKTNLTIVEKMIFSFHPYILEEIWGCPKEFLEKYSENSDLSKYLNCILYGHRCDLLSIPVPIVDLLDHHEKAVSDTKMYRDFFHIKTPIVHKTDEIRIVEDTEGNTIGVFNTGMSLRNGCTCGSKYGFSCECAEKQLETYPDVYVYDSFR